MIVVEGSIYDAISEVYNYHGQVDALNRFFPPSQPFRYKSTKPESFAIGHHGGRPIMVDDPDVLRVCYELRDELPRYTGGDIEYKAQPFDSILGKDYERMSTLINVPPTPAGYYLTHDSDSREMDPTELESLDNVCKFIFPDNFISLSNKYSFLRKDSSVGMPFHSSSILAKVNALKLGYEVAWYMSDNKIVDPLEFNKILFDKFKLLNLYKIGTRGQIDHPSKVRKDYLWNGKEVEQNKLVSQYKDYNRMLINEARSLYPNDTTYHEWIQNQLYCRRFRQIMIMPPIGTLLALAQRTLISYRKDIFPHLVDKGSAYNILALVSHSMKPKIDELAMNNDDLFFVSMDQKNFDRRWHSKVMSSFLQSYDKAARPPFNIMYPFIMGSGAITQPMNKKDAFATAFVTHDTLTYNGGMNMISNPSGSPSTKMLNDSASTFIMECICNYMKLGSFIEASMNGLLMTDKFPLSALVNGDDVIICVKGKQTLHKLLDCNSRYAGEWQLEFDTIPKWNNQKIVFDKDNKLYMVKNHENLAEKILKPEKAFGFNASGTRKPLPNYGFKLRELEYQTPQGIEMFRIMNDVSKKYIGHTFSEIYEMTPSEENFLQSQIDPEQAINILSYLSDPDKLQYVSELETIPDIFKSLYYFQITPDHFRAIMEKDQDDLLKLFKTTDKSVNKLDFLFSGGEKIYKPEEVEEHDNTG